jgi:hypothetical protein
MFTELEPGFDATDPAPGRRDGLKTAIAAVRQWRRVKHGRDRLHRATPDENRAAFAPGTPDEHISGGCAAETGNVDLDVVLAPAVSSA